MTEITTERGQDGPWPWIVGLIVLALLVWVVAGVMIDRPQQTPAGERSTQGAATESRPKEPPPLPWPVAAGEGLSATAPAPA